MPSQVLLIRLEQLQTQKYLKFFFPMNLQAFKHVKLVDELHLELLISCFGYIFDFLIRVGDLCVMADLKGQDLSNLEFEVRSSTDGAW